MIESGENISYTIVRKKGSSYHITSRDGTMIEYGEENSRVKGKDGKVRLVETNGIRLAGEKNALTEALFPR